MEYIFFLKKKYFIYFAWNIRVPESEEETEGDRSSTHWFTLQMTTMAIVEPVRSWEPGVSSRSLSWSTRVQELEPSSVTFQGHTQKASKGRGAAEQKPACLWDAGASRQGISL